MTGLVWTPWNGEGPCPVPPDEFGSVRFRDGDEDHNCCLDAYRWSHRGTSSDIIAYALEPQTPSVDWQAVGPKLVEALEAAERLCAVALPQFDWGKSALSGDAIRLLNEAPGKIRQALSLAQAQEPQP